MSFHATGLMLVDVVLGAGSVKPDSTHAIAFLWLKCFYQREMLAKTEWFDRQHAAPQSHKMVLDTIYHGGRHSEIILLILLKKKCLPESSANNVQFSGQ